MADHSSPGGFSDDETNTAVTGLEDMALFDRERHEPLTDTAWNEVAVRCVIDRIVADTEHTFTEQGLWPLHPIDVSPERASILKPVYYGAAGVIWALRYLHGAGAAELTRDYLPAVGRLLAAHRADSLELTGAPVPGYPVGDAGILLLHWTLAPSAQLADALHAAIESNAHHPALGFAWGGAGSMLASLFMVERTGEARWKQLYLRICDVLWRSWEYHADVGCHLWTQDLYGGRARHVGGLHGFPGIMFCMLRGRDLLPAERQSELVQRAHRAVQATAAQSGQYANWPLTVEQPAAVRLQHCVGAPGMINCLMRLPSEPATDALLLAGGELTWHAGPLVKLPSLCHGVPGSAFAFLKLFQRTGNDEWLERARRFAMHAIEQNERFTQAYGQRKYSLWTGDLGLAVYLWHCIGTNAEFPTLDFF